MQCIFGTDIGQEEGPGPGELGPPKAWNSQLGHRSHFLVEQDANSIAKCFTSASEHSCELGPPFCTLTGAGAMEAFSGGRSHLLHCKVLLLLLGTLLCKWSTLLHVLASMQCAQKQQRHFLTSQGSCSIANCFYSSSAFEHVPPFSWV